ncbi:MAG: response regulator transcription factor [Oscillospiraceae bacterium]|nr:response regulator transcription factor [Oscillospiraceae bacterium]MDD4369213.1 response regulator transcription factor [Oscillospiraceae bacterium]
MPLIYIVDDEPHIRRLAAEALKDYGMDTETFANGTEFMAAVRHKVPDAAILDWMMPPPDGLELCRRLRQEAPTAQLPIIILTAKSDETDRVLGLELGADDYISKPFGVRELAARVRALLRRRSFGGSSEQVLLQSGGLTLDVRRRRVTKNGEAVELTLREFDLLQLLMTYPGQVFSRDQLLDRVWKTNYFGDTRTVDVHVRYLRQKLEDHPEQPQLILTVRGVGYCFTDSPPQAQ